MPRTKNEWDYLVESGPLLAAERIKSYATSVGVVAALVGVMSVQCFMVPPATVDTTSRGGEAFGLLSALAIVANLIVVLASTIIYCQINMVSTHADVQWLLQLMSNMMIYDICTYTFITGVCLLTCALCVSAFLIYTNVVGFIFAALSAAAAIVLVVFFLLIDAAVRKRLQATVSSRDFVPASSSTEPPRVNNFLLHAQQ